MLSWFPKSIKGWAYDPATPEQPVTLDLMVDGEPVDHVICNGFRKADPVDDVPHSRAGIKTMVPPIFWDGKPHLVALVDPRNGETLHEAEMTTPRYAVPGLADPAWGQLLEGGPELTGWVANGIAPLTVELEVDQVLVDVQAADGPFPDTLRELFPVAGIETGTFAFRLPARLYDDAEHVIAISVVDAAGARAPLARRRMPLLRDAAPQFTGALQPLERSVLPGRLVATNAPDTVLEISLLLDKVEIGSARTDPADGGSFRFDLGSFTILELAGADIAAIVFPDGVPVPFRGGHPVRDTLTVALASTGTAPHIRVEAGVPLGAALAYRLTDGAETLAEGVIAPDGDDPHAGAIAIDPTLATRAGLTLELAGCTFPLRRSDAGAEVQAAVAPAVAPTRALRSFVAPDHARVRQRLGELARGLASPEQHAAADYSGAWRVTRDDVLEGWALDLADPGDALTVELVIDGEVRATDLARRMTQAREARLTFELPLGFRFTLGRIKLPVGVHQVEARIAGGGTLLPGQPRAYAVTAERENEVLVERIDDAVAQGRPFEAMLLAAGVRGVSDLQDRLLLLDFALRAEWHVYPAFLLPYRSGGNVALAELLEQLAQGRDAALLDELRPMARALEVPPAYVDAVARNLAPDASAYAERLAFAVARRGLPEGKRVSPAPERLAIACAFAREDADPAFHAQLEALAAAGCVVSWHAPAPAAQIAAALAPSLAAGSAIAILSEPRLVGVAAAGLWPHLAARGRVQPTLATLAAGTVPAAQRELAGRQADAAVTLLSRDAPAGSGDAPHGQPEVLSWRIAGEGAGAGGTSCLVLAQRGAALPALPSDARAIRYDAGSDEADDPVDLALAQLSPDIPAETPVIVLDPGFPYPVDYCETLLRVFTLGGGASTLAVEIAYDRETSTFRVAPDDVAPAFVGLAALGCYRAEDLRAPATSQGAHLVAARTRPFLVATDLHAPLVIDAAVEIQRRLSPATGLVDQQLGFEASARTQAMRAGALSEPGAHAQLSDASARALLRLYPSEFPHEAVAELIELGRSDEAADLLLDWLRNSVPIRQPREAALRGLLEATKRLCLQDEVSRYLAPQVPRLGAAYPGLLIQLFEVLATSSAPGDVAAALIAASHHVLADKAARPIYRIIDLCRRFCSPQTMVVLLHLIDGSQHARMLTSDDTGRVIGETLIGNDLADFRLPETGLDLAHFVARAPLLLQIADALQAGTRAQVIRLVNSFLATRREYTRLIGALRTFSWELSQLAIAQGEIFYPGHGTPEERLSLAIVLGDRTTIDAFDTARRNIVWSEQGAPSIVAATYRGDFGPLNAWFARMAADCGASPVTFAGGTIQEMFEGLAAQQRPKLAAAPAGRVTTLLTVYNPDLPLLELSITSLLQQTWPDLEIILVDDASDLVDPEAIEAVADRDPRIRFIRSSRNSGPYVCRNKALEIATGDWIAIQDDDDFSHPERFERQLAALAEGDGVLKMCTTSHLRIDAGARLQFEHNFGILGDGTMTSLFRRDVFDTLGGFARVRSRGDVEFRERIKAAYGTHVYAHLTCPSVFCYARPGSLSNMTARTLPGYLALWRDNFGKRVHTPVLNGASAGAPVGGTKVPWPLRPL